MKLLLVCYNRNACTPLRIKIEMGNVIILQKCLTRRLVGMDVKPYDKVEALTKGSFERQEHWRRPKIDVTHDVTCTTGNWLP